METYGKCPKCAKGELIQGTIGYLCNYCKSLEDKCDFIIYREYFRKEITPAMIKQLLESGKTGVFRDLQKRDGGTFSASLTLENFVVKPSFETTFLDGATCPICKGKIIETGKAFMCENYHHEQSKCPVYISHTIAGTSIASNDVIALLTGLETSFLTFTSNTGKVFLAKLVLDDEGKVNFERTLCKCPKCGGNIYGGDKAYGCSNYAAEIKCDFTIWKEIFGKKITQDIVVQLCTEKETKIMKGFKTKTGEPLERKLILSPDFRVEII